jgi:hypothetical protein
MFVTPSASEKILAFVRENAIALTAGVASVLFGVIAILQARRANRLSSLQAKIAQEKPSIELSMFNLKDIDAFILAVPLRKGRVVAVPIPFSLKNTGERSATDIQLYLRLPKPLCFNNLANYEYSAPFREINFSNVDTENFRTLILGIKAIHPNENHICSFQLSLPFDTTLRLSKRITANIAFIVDATVAQKDARTFSKEFTLEVIDTSDSEPAEILKRMNRQIAKDKIGPRILREAFGVERTSRHIAIVEFSKQEIKPDPHIDILDRIEPPTQARVITGMELEDGSYIVVPLGVKPFNWR